PTGHCSPIGRDNPELSERSILPAVGRPQDDWDDAGLTLVMPLHCPLQLGIPAVVRGNEVWADQQEDDRGGIQVLVNLPLPLGSRGYLPVMPVLDNPEPLEDTQVV